MAPPRRIRSRLTRLVPLPLAAALLTGLAVSPDLLTRPTNRLDDAAPAASSSPWFEDTAAEQLRQDQCLMADVLRLGGTAMATTAQDALNRPAAELHAIANRKYWEDTPLATAFKNDRAAADKALKDLAAQHDAWKKPLEGLTNPAGFTVTGFAWPPDGSDGKPGFYTQTGLDRWTADRFWQDEGTFYKDPTPAADDATRKAVTDLGTPLYGKDPDPGLPSDEWNRALAEHDAFQWLTDTSGQATGADDARIFLTSGGFPRTAPEPGSPEYRIAVEDLKSRFSTCAWRDPLDPRDALSDATATAAAEWQQEIASQATQRNQILTANKDATKALTAGAKALGDLVGQSWTADHLTRWQDYWSAGGVGAIGNAPTTIEVTGKKGLCLDAAGGGTTDGTAVQIYTCNGSAAQQWTVEGDDKGLHLRNVKALKCVEVAGNKSADGTKIQLATCKSTPAQTWEYNVRAATPLKNVGTGKCLDLKTYDNGQDSRLWTCSGATAQKVTIKPSGQKGSVPPKAQFDKAKAGLTAARASAANQLTALKAQLAAAKKAATASDTAEQAAYTIADQQGAPRGRGLLVGQQKAQVTKGAVAALEAMVKAGETAEAATRASASDSDTIAQRALAQAAQAKAEFRKKAAETAELQAKAAADAAKVHRDNAKKDKETAEAKLAVALKAEGEAKSAATTAHAKRLAAEAEEKTAKAEKEKAAAKQAEAEQHKKTAQAEAANAKEAREKAEASEGTAVEKRNAAVKARDHAKSMRDDAWDAEQKADAARAKADAKAAYADSLEAGSAADAARAAANQADKHADDAEAAAGRARSAADAATQAAADADAAATRAESAAKRARANADAAQAAKLKADAAVKTATSAAADAIKASQHASAEAKTAVKLADEAEAKAKTAKSEADEANKEAGKALAASAKAAGFAYVTAQAAVDAGKAAAQVAKPANDAIQLGSPYVDTDSVAGLVVLAGQGSKTIAEQQQAVAETHAENAQEEAASSQALADQAKGDAKAAYQHAANAAKHASDARGYAKEALGYAADAAKAASKAVASLARTKEYDRQAAEDAAAADKAAGRAESHAKAARDSADEAALDAEAARKAASAAEADAKEARAAADRADKAATEAEEAAKDAAKYAKEAQEAAERAEKAQNAEQIKNGTVPDGNGGSIGKVFYVIDHIEKVGDPEVVKKTSGCDGWIDKLFYNGDCTITQKIRYRAVLDLYLCTAEDMDPQKYTCPAEATRYIGEMWTDVLSQTITHTITIEEYQRNVDPVDILFGSWIACAQKFSSGFTGGSWGGCAWASLDIASLFAGKIIKPIAEALRAVDAAFVTGVGVREAFRALKALDGVDAAAVAAIEREVKLYEELRTACKVNSFPGTTEVVLADGGRKMLRDVRRGDQLLATDPETGRTQGEPVTRTFSHSATDLVDVTLADGGSLTSTPGHRFFVVGRGWTLASELREGDVLPTPDGVRAVTSLVERQEAKPRTVYDLTVSGLHTFYAVAGDSPVLVHNCNDLVFDASKFPGQAHTLSEHTGGLVSPERAVELAKKKTEKAGKVTPNSLFVDQETAQRAVDHVLSLKANQIKNWLKKNASQELTLQAEFGPRGSSLGKVYYPDETVKNAGNGVFMKLVRAPGHKSGFYVQTCYPK
ncbi:RICIN domain-containing protein [Streptomyces sp. NPDC003333]